MARWFYALLVGLVGAGIVHVAILFLLPSLSERDVWSQLARQAPTNTFFPLGRGGRDNPFRASIDPLFEAVACRVDLSEGAVRIVGDVRSPYWSLSVYDRIGQNAYSLNDRTVGDGRLDLVLLTPTQMAELRKQVPTELSGSVFMEADLDLAIIVLRSFMPDPTWEPTVTGFLDGVRCERLQTDVTS